MTASIANSRMTVAALFGTVTTTANAATQTVSGIADAASLFSSAMENMRTNQAARHAADQETYIDVYSLEKAAEVEKIQHEIRSSLSSDPARQASFNELHDRIKARMLATRK